jgi:hypothetical protein
VTDSEVFKESYTEVLLFLKHQDDKINRVLTALAFLTAAGVALYIQGRTNSPLLFANHDVEADNYFFASFLFGLFFALSIALVALDPTSVVPRYLDPEGSTSILFWQSIGGRESEQWAATRGPGAAASLADSFHLDARRLAHRARHKVRRFGQATAFVQLAVVSLTLLGLIRLSNASEHGRWVLATVLLTLFSAMPLIDFEYQRRLNFPDVGSEYVRAAKGRLAGRSILWYAKRNFFLPFFIVSTVGLILDFSHVEPVTFALFGTLLLRLLAHELPPKRWAVTGLVIAWLIPACEAAWLWWWD